MTVFLLSESKEINHANCLTGFPSAEDLQQYAEPIDVLNKEYAAAFDTEGRVYEVKVSQPGGRVYIEEVSQNLPLVKKVIEDYLRRSGLFDQTCSLEDNARKLYVRGWFR